MYKFSIAPSNIHCSVFNQSVLRIVLLYNDTMRTVQLRPGTNLPMLGFGTYSLTDGDLLMKVLDAALGCGYRQVDTGQIYGNEAQIGRALTALLPKHNLQRKDISITSKLHPKQNMSADRVRPSVEQSLRDLQTDYIDLFLIHYPRPFGSSEEKPNSETEDKNPKAKDIRRECWLELEKLHAEGKLRAIGVSNYEVRHLDEMGSYAKVQPAVNQCEFHPHLCRRDLVDAVKQRGIHFQAYSPLGRHNPQVVSEPVLVELAQKYKVPVSNILLAWSMALGISVIPSSDNPEYIGENFKALQVKLADEDIEKIWSVHKHISYTACRPWDVI